MAVEMRDQLESQVFPQDGEDVSHGRSKLQARSAALPTQRTTQPFEKFLWFGKSYGYVQGSSLSEQRRNSTNGENSF